jgi:hypothetical protein
MSNDEFVKQKKSKGKKKASGVAKEPEIMSGIQSQFAPLEMLIVEPLEMPAPIQTKPKKISPLIRNAIKSQPEELQFTKKVEQPIHVKKTENQQVIEDDSEDESEEDEENPEEDEEEGEDVDYGMCPGCYHCNWTGSSSEGKANCKRNYYGDVN